MWFTSFLASNYEFLGEYKSKDFVRIYIYLPYKAIINMYKCLRLLMGVVSLLGGMLLGLLTSYLVQKKNNPYWPYEPWHHSTEELAWNAALSTLVAVVAFYFHNGDIYLIVVKWPPPRLFSWQFGGITEKENKVKTKCTYIPILWLCIGHSFLSWVYLFWTIEHELIFLPFSVSCIFCGAFSEFTAKKCRRLIKFGCGRESYEILTGAASSVAIGLAIEGEGKINYSLDMEENPMINNSDSEESSISEDTSDSDSGSDSDIGDMEARNISRKKRKYKAKDEIFNNALRSSSESSSDSNSSDDDVYQEADKDRKLVLKQMSKNRRDGNNWQKKNTSAHFAAWMNDDDEVEFRVPRSRLHQV